jgi:hypothetical protein
MSGAQPASHRRRSSWTAWPLSIVVPSLAFVVGLVKVVTTYGRPYYHYGDQAILALRVGDAMRFHAEVGPYSRFGWSHPGPALFYLLAPVYSLSGNNPRSLLAGSLLINGVCIVATLMVVHRFAGEWSTRWAVAVVGVALLALGANAIETFWNPSLEAPAVLLVMVLTAGAISGSGLSVVWMAVVGSYVVQTDVGTAPLVGVMAVCSIIGYLTQAGIRRRHHREVDHRERGLTPAMLGILGLVVLIFAWIPPLVQEFAGHPGNLSALYDFFTKPSVTAAKFGSTHGLSAAWATVANSTTAVPWGNFSASASMTTAAMGRQETLVFWGCLALAGMIWAGCSRRWFALGLSVTSLVGLVVSVISVERIVGPIGDYLTYWMALVPAPGAIAIGVLSVESLRERTTSPSPTWWRAPLVWAMAIVSIVPAVFVGRQLARGSVAIESDGNTEVGQLSAFAIAHLRSVPDRSVLVVMGNADRWPEASGLVLQLARDGYHPTVTREWEFMFTKPYVASSAPRAQLVLTDGIQGTPPGSAGLSQTYSVGDVPTTITFVEPLPTLGG